MDRQPLTLQQAAQNLQGVANPQAQLSPVDYMMQLRDRQQDIQNQQQLRVQQAQQSLADIQSKPKQKDYTAVAALADMFRPQGAQGPSMTAIYSQLKPKDTSLQEQALAQRNLLQAQGAMDNTMMAGLKNQMAQAQDIQDYDFKRKLLEQRQEGDLELQRLRNAMAMQKDDVKPSKGQEALDKSFGKNIEGYMSGGRATVAANLNNLDTAMERLGSFQGDEFIKANDAISGPMVSMMPDFMRSRSAAASKDTQDLVRQVVQQDLRQTLGAQFTEKEGELMIRNAYDPTLDEKVNYERLQRLTSKVKAAAKAKEDMYKYWLENDGSLKGYKGAKFETLVDDMKEEFGAKSTTKNKQPTGQQSDRASELRKKYGL